MESLIDYLIYLIITPFQIILHLLEWAFKAAVLGIIVYGAWFFISTPFIYLWKAIKKLFGIGRDEPSQ